MQPLWRLTVWLACAWVLCLFYGELLAFWVPHWRCSWPDLDPDLKAHPVRVALIADPQLTARTWGPSFASRFRQFYSDIYMRRAFRSCVLTLDPDEIIFLGDHFDGGAYFSDSEWDESVRRFNHIFDQTQRGLKSRLAKTIPVHFLPGNHDLLRSSQNPKIVERYRRVFGATDYSFKIGSIEFVFVNAQSLDASMTDSAYKSSWAFVEGVASRNASGPKVLLTHIPLYRPEGTPCGPEQESGGKLRSTSLRSGRTIYEDNLTNGSSLKLLHLIKPVMVLSGHYHDQFKLVHSTEEGSFPEYTVGTFSWQQGNLHPSFMMLSVAPVASETMKTVVSARVCFLPVQSFIFACYALLLIVTIMALLLWPSQGVDIWPVIHKLLKTAKEKDEDAEWDMVWDAEGGMHLVRKVYPQSSTSQQAETTERRGTAVLRASAKSRAAEMAEPDASTSAQTLATRGRMSSLHRRLINIAGPLLFLSTLNSSLYMMLVTKDWA